MNDAAIMTNTPKGGRWLKRLAWLGAGLILLFAALYFVGTSSAFFKSMILPRIGKALNAEVSVADAEISPFSKVVLHEVKVAPNGEEPIFAATSVTARYDLFSIIRGHAIVDKVAVVAPTVTVIEKAEGTSNLDPLLSSGKLKTGPAVQPAQAANPASPMSVYVKSVRLDNATVRYVKNLKSGGHETVELTQANIAAGNIKNGESGKLDINAVVAMDKAAGAAGSNTVIQARLKGTFAFQLTQDLKPGP